MGPQSWGREQDGAMGYIILIFIVIIITIISPALLVAQILLG